MIVNISIDGCDDSTKFKMDITEKELMFLEELVKESKKVSTYGCMPTVSFKTK